MIKTKKSGERKVIKKITKKTDNTPALKENIVKGMQEKKAKEIVCIDLRNIKNAIADFFIICHADSKPHIDAIATSVEEYVYRKTGEEPLHREGKANAEWILLDYSTVIVHVFRHEQRDFYGIERLWADAEIEKIASNY
jgi:ribosome-associated protein